MLDPFLLVNIKKMAVQAKGVDKLIANYILKNLANISKVNINDLANECFVSRTSIIRFCNRLNLEGFRELKLRLKLINKANVSGDKQVTLLNDDCLSERNFYNVYLKFLKLGFDNVYKSASSGQVEKIAQWVLQAHKVYLFAFSLSYSVCQHFLMQLYLVKKNVQGASDLNYISFFVDELHDDDVVFIVSLSGNNQELIKLTQQIRHNCKCKIVVIVGNEAHQFKEYDELVILQNLEQNLWDSYSITSQMVIQWFDMLFYYLISNYKDKRRNDNEGTI